MILYVNKILVSKGVESIFVESGLYLLRIERLYKLLNSEKQPYRKEEIKI